jgi:histone demethylase JARID1
VHGGVKCVQLNATLQSFTPDFVIDYNKFEFQPRLQKLNELEALSRVRHNFYNELASFWHLQV